MPPFAAKGHYPPFVVLFPPFPPASTQTGSANTFTLISFLDYSSVWRYRGSDVCISSGRTTFDGARQSGHATETPLRRLMNRVRGQFGPKPHLEFPRALGHLSPRSFVVAYIFRQKPELHYRKPVRLDELWKLAPWYSVLGRYRYRYRYRYR